MTTGRHMQGVSAQNETLRKKDERHHPAKCVNAERIEEICFCESSLSPLLKNSVVQQRTGNIMSLNDYDC